MYIRTLRNVETDIEKERQRVREPEAEKYRTRAIHGGRERVAAMEVEEGFKRLKD